MKLHIPKKPKDGYRVTFWRHNHHHDGLIQVRWTYIKNRSCEDVCDPNRVQQGFYKRGLPYVDQWYIESRYVPVSGEISEWSGTGRNDHAIVHELQSLADSWETFNEARLKLALYLRAEMKELEARAKRTADIAAMLAALKEPA